MMMEGEKVWLTKAQRDLIKSASKRSGEWSLEHDGLRDALEELQEYGFLELKRSRGTAYIAFRIPDDTLIFQTPDGHHMTKKTEKAPEHSVYVRFERGADDIVGPTFGPYELAQLTYDSIRVVSSSHGDIDLAQYARALGGEWWICDQQHFDTEMEGGRVDLSTCHNIEDSKILTIWYSDIIIYSHQAP